MPDKFDNDKFDYEYLYCMGCGKRCLPEELIDYSTKTGIIKFKWYCYSCHIRKLNIIEV